MVTNMVYTGTDTFKISRHAPANQNNFGFSNARRHFLKHFFKLKQSFNLKTTCLRKVNQSFLRFHCHITYSCEFSTSAVVTPARFKMAVDFSCLKRNKNQFVFRVLGWALETFLILWANIGKSSEDVGSTLGQFRKSSEDFRNLLPFFPLKG